MATTPRIIHIGKKNISPSILEDSGFSVAACTSIDSFACVLARHPFPSAVAVSNTASERLLRVASSACSTSVIALIYLKGNDQGRSMEESAFFKNLKFDLVVPSFPSSEWIKKVRSTIEQTSSLRKHFDELCKDFATTLNESATLSRDAVTQMEKCRLLRKSIEAARGRGDLP